MKEGDLVIRIWPSRTITMGMARRGVLKDELMFLSLENYDKEGGVHKDDTYGYIDQNGYKHRPPTVAEIYIFNKRGYLKITESEATTLYRDEIINEII